MQRESLKYYDTRRDERAGREGKKGRGWGARKMRLPPLRAKVGLNPKHLNLCSEDE